MHQFDKVEMFSFVRPEDSDNEHELLLSLEEKLMQGLKLPHQVVQLCSVDIGAPSARTFDIETWMPSRNQYGETHSGSALRDFQARRLNIRYRSANSKQTMFCYTLNNTAIATPRVLTAVIENYQNANGSITVPEVLRAYMGGVEKIG